ncbi:MAG TPA: gephyrin-like molybdotransferase Glp [Acidobacteriaceae bacterium]|nr:gephyrin-like molybdotransferase Glp [Acidobacteriaceae bacterium]
MSERVLEFEEALAEVLRHAAALAKPARNPEPVALEDAVGRVIAEPVRADRDQPPFGRSTRDGYAVRSVDVSSTSSTEPLRIVGSVRAGEIWRGAPVGNCEAVEIMTGAPLPDGADAVLMVEHAEIGADGRLRVAAGRTLVAGENVVPRGAEARAGAELIPAGRRIGAAEIALAASCGYTRLNLFEQPKVAIVATGDELVKLNTKPEAWQIYNSNSYALAAMVCDEGGFGGKLEIAKDTLGDLRERIAQAGAWDLLLLSGGVSMGKYDLVEQVLAECGAEFFFTGAMIQPGKPMVFGRMRRDQGSRIRDQRERNYFFGLPGNPVSTEVCFRLFVAPMLRALAGQTQIAPRFIEAKLAEEVKGGARVTRFLPAVIESDWKHVSVRVVPWQGSGDLAANALANGFVVLPNGVERFAAGESVRVLLR